MNDEEFFKKVKEMRWAQKAYYSTPAWNDREKKKLLIRSKNLEAEIDREISRRDWAASNLFTPANK